MKAERRAAIVVLALSVMAIVPLTAFADSINLFAAKRPPNSDDQASASIDEDCVDVNDRNRTSSSRFGDVRWSFSQLTWDWTQSNDPSLVYILCVDTKREASPLSGGDGGLGFMAGLSWSGAQPATRASSGAPPIPTVVSGERPISIETNHLPTMSPGHPLTGFSPALSLNEVFPSSNSLAIGASSPFAGDASSGSGLYGNEDTVIAPFDPPIAFDPGEMAPVPEPGTLLLVGTGLAAAWRAARKRT